MLNYKVTQGGMFFFFLGGGGSPQSFATTSKGLLMTRAQPNSVIEFHEPRQGLQSYLPGWLGHRGSGVAGCLGFKVRGTRSIS